jgi:hypothetical protein
LNTPRGRDVLLYAKRATFYNRKEDVTFEDETHATNTLAVVERVEVTVPVQKKRKRPKQIRKRTQMSSIRELRCAAMRVCPLVIIQSTFTENKKIRPWTHATSTLCSGEG